MSFKTVYRTVLIAALCACTACASTGNTPHQRSADALSLDDWLSETAGPELTALMGEHPMFKNEPFLIAALKDEEIIPVQDNVTRQIRESLTADLLNKPGVALAWRPDAERAVAFEDLSDPGSRQLSKIRYYIGIEADIDPLDNMLEVDIRILNVDEKKWVPGISLNWRGVASKAQRLALTPAEVEQPAASEPDTIVIPEAAPKPEALEKTPVIVEVTAPQPKPEPIPSYKNESDKGFD